MRKKQFIFVLMAAAALLAGCTKKYEQSDIQSYVKERLGLKDYTVSAACEEIEDEEGFTDKVWTVMDEEKDIVFHVVDDHSWGMESESNYLRDDYGESAFLKYQDQLPESSLIRDGRIVITTGTDCDGAAEVSIAVLYADRAELQSAVNELKEIREFFKEKDLEQVSPGVQIQYEGPSSYPCMGQMIGGEIQVQLNSDMDYVFNYALNKYILTGLDYRLEEVFADTAEAERQEVILADDTPRVGIVREDGETEYYDDLVGNRFGYGLSVSTLYLVLEREGLQPKGEPEHFTCIGVSGAEYEFSCAFVSETIGDEECAYYLADGEPVKLGFAYNIHITAAKASELFGISIRTDWNKTIAENKEKTSSQSAA